MHIITDNDLFQRLAFDNPWWSLRPETEIRFKQPAKRVQFAAFRSRHMALEPGHVLVLAGPLRAGKTVLMRQAIAALVKDGVPPSAVFYAPLTTPSYATTSVATLFEMFCRRYRHGPDARIFVFFDEVQYLPNWRRDILALARARPNARIACAVSSLSPALTTGTTAEDGLMEVFVLPPISFLEFMRFRGSEENLFVRDAAGRRMFRESELPVLNEEFLRYINFGGFPEGIMHKTEGAPAPTFVRDGLADRVLHKDLAALSAISETSDLNRLFSFLAFNSGREISIEELAGLTGTAKNTLRKYLDHLESAFLIRRLRRVDQNAQAFQRAVAFRVFLTSPCLYTALFGPLTWTSEALPRLVATALVGQTLDAEDFDRQAYASWRGGKIDLLRLDPRTGWPDHVCDIDWSDDIVRGRKKPDTLARFVRNNNRAAVARVLTRSTARRGSLRGVDIELIPASVYAYFLHRDRLARPKAPDKAAE